MKYIFWLGLFLVSLSFGCQAQQIIIGTPTLVPSNIQVTANPSTITIGGVTTLSAQLVDGGNNPRGDVTRQCAWSSSDTTVLGVNGNLGTGISTGSAQAICTLGNIVGTTPATVTVSAVSITTPNALTCANPCPLPQGVNGTPYSGFSFVATTANPPITWSIPIGSLPAWASLNTSTGAITGTPNAVATTNFTIKATDNSANFATLPVSLTVIAGSGFGPPTYGGSTTSNANPGVITSYFTSSSAQNSTAHDPTLNPSTDCIDLATTLATSFNGKSQTGSMSGGANGHDWSWDETMLAESNDGGGVSILGVTTNGSGCPQVTNPGIPAWHNLLGAVAFDWYTTAGRTNHTIYLFKSKHIIQTANVTDLNVLGTFTTVFDFTAAGACPGPIPANNSGSIFTPVSDGNGGLQFAQALGTSGQGSATQVFVYSTTKGCTQLDLGNGVYYPWCNTGACGSVASVPLSTSGNYCWGFSSTTDAIHDGQPSGDGTVFRISVISGGHAMTHGVCAGITKTGTVAWTIGTGTTIYTNGEVNGSANCPVGINCQYDGHPSEGYSKALGSGGGLGFNIRNVSNYAGAFTFAAPQIQSFNVSPYTNIPQDNHGAWPPAGNFNDAFPMWLGATDLILNTSLSPCAPTGIVYCPPYLAQVAFALPIDGSSNRPHLFVHTHSCGQPGGTYATCTDGPDSYFNDYDAVCSASPQGNYLSCPSTDLHSFGLDSTNKFDSNILIIRLQ